MSAGYIAIVDDDESIRRAMARLLELHSFRVQTYSSGRELLDSLKIETPACLLVDLQLKNEMSGLDLLHQLSGTGLRIPTIVVTAEDEPGIRHRCKLAGAVAFLTKPVMADLLLEAIRTAMTTSDRTVSD